ncbi:hypothetical protein ACVNSK_10475 [Corynebacterium propinquum]|uniref:hypothetical protein n=1 Tax=Corynebacterium propinquum TaxID=43769 RepID=UPI00223AF0F8|nr:hypothetical protein [Corynebacterium propinquum]MCT1819365.1 hypothetical protein [Corynebacterium propinquum]
MTEVLRTWFRVPGGRKFPPGTALEGDALEHARMRGALTTHVPESARREPEVKAAPAPVVESEPVSEDKPKVKRPAKAAPTSEWEAFLKSQGVNPKGMKKAEMIAAVS